MKRLFQVLDEMNVADGDNNTQLVAVSNTLISAEKVKQGTKVSMGCDDQSLFNIMNGKVIPILVLVNKDEYLRIKDL